MLADYSGEFSHWNFSQKLRRKIGQIERFRVRDICHYYEIGYWLILAGQGVLAANAAPVLHPPCLAGNESSASTTDHRVSHRHVL